MMSGVQRRYGEGDRDERGLSKLNNIQVNVYDIAIGADGKRYTG
jgi:hypothetical protein